MDIWARLGMTCLNFDLVPMAMSSVLSSFIFNLIIIIYIAQFDTNGILTAL